MINRSIGAVLPSGPHRRRTTKGVSRGQITVDEQLRRSLQGLVQGASAALGNIRCCILRLDESTGVVAGLSTSHAQRLDSVPLCIELEEEAARRAIVSRREISIEDVKSDGHFVRHNRRRVSSFAAAPIIFQGKVFGAMTAVSARRRAFGRRRIRILKSFAVLAAQTFARERELDKDSILPSQGIELLSLVSHEMRTPLTTILALTSLILAERAGSLGGLQREFLSSIQLGAKRLSQLADLVLDFYSAESGQFRIRREELQIDEVIAGVLKQLEPGAIEQGVHLTSDVGANIPSVMGDRKRLEQVLTNLVGNAIRLGRKDGSVMVSAEQLEGELRVVVEDDGIEMTTEERARIFDALERPAVRFRGATGRFGLGLEVAKLIVEHHNGSIWIESRYGEKGSRFCFSLPLSGL